MYKTAKSILSLVAAALCSAAFTACDNVDQSDRFIELPKIESERVVLIEEFTGQKCVNCPDGHAILEALQEQYPDNLVVVSIHGGGDSWSYSEEDYPFGLRNQEGQAYSEAYGVTTFPSAIVDRKTGLLDRDKWGTAVYAEMAKASDMTISASASAADGKISVSISAELLSGASRPIFVQAWVLESGIVARQQSGQGMISRYEHNNVFRGCVNGPKGEERKFDAGKPQEFTYVIDAKEDWELENLSIVAFAYDATDGVMQAAKCPVAL